MSCSAAALETVPPAPPPSDWTFKAELAEPIAYHAPEAYRIADDFGLTGQVETVLLDLNEFMRSAPTPARKTLTLQKGHVVGHESYRVAVAPSGDVTLTAEDEDGIRRAAVRFEDRVLAGDLKDEVRRPWLRNRISRCYFAPIKRPPFNRDELMDDIDYYPEAYLNRLAHEGVNGLWLTVELRNLVKTSFNERDPDAPRRLAKLRRTVARCRRWGIRTWIFCIEPHRLERGNPLLARLPPEAFAPSAWEKGTYVMCPSSPLVRQYVEEAFRDLFEQVPGLPGVINISHGERPTSCLSFIDAVSGRRGSCPRCRDREPWMLHADLASAVVKGMRAHAPGAEFLSWFYQPYVEYERAPWVAEVARHLPDGVTMLYNFESGAVREQLGRYRAGGDYWLSYAGPAPAFRQVAESAQTVNGALGAKIQVGCSHECATLPYIPVPGLLWRKYAAMQKAGCTSVMQCWYFGGCPGIMNKAAGELAFSDFTDTEDAFLVKLARPFWGREAPQMAAIWKRLSDAYANYPMSNDMQYYGPFHAGVAWPLLPGIEMRPLARTWKPQDAPSGDAIGECLENHTLAEAAVLADRMRKGAELKDAHGGDLLAALETRYAGNRERMRDLAVMRALQLLFASGADILEFYRQREIAVTASRETGDAKRARTALVRMMELIRSERAVTEKMLPLARADSRLGFHPEAESHQFHPAKLEWRLNELNAAMRELETIDQAVAAGKPYPLSEHERTAPVFKAGETVKSADGSSFVWRFLGNGDFELCGQVPTGRSLNLYTMNRCATAWPQRVNLWMGGYDVPARNIVSSGAVVSGYESQEEGNTWRFRLVLDARGWNGDVAQRPGWLYLSSGGQPVWPAIPYVGDHRLNIGHCVPSQYGRLIQ